MILQVLIAMVAAGSIGTSNWSCWVNVPYTIQQYLVHYHAERNHQGLAHQLIAPEPGRGSRSGQAGVTIMVIDY